MPFSLPSSSGITRPIALAAPVEVGIRFTAAARARRRSLCGASCRRWSERVGVDRGHDAVLDADGVVQHLRHRGQAVRRARRVRDDVVLLGVVGVVVHAQHERHVGVAGGRGDDDLLRAAPRGAWRRPSRLVKKPVDSITTSAPTSPQGSAAGSVSAKTRSSLPSTMMPSLGVPRPRPGTARGSSRTSAGARASSCRRGR